MNWEAMGAIGEVAGAAGVILTLIYLAIQIRHSKQSMDANTRAMRGQAISDVTQNIQSEMQLILNGQDAASALMKLNLDEELTDRDMLLAEAYLTSSFMARQNEFLQHKQGLLDDEVFRSLQHPIVLMLSSASAQRWWAYDGRKWLSPDFVAFVESVIEQQPGRHWREVELGSSSG